MRISEANKLRTLYFLFFSCTAAWLPIFADYLEDHGMKGRRIGILLSVTPFMMLAVQPFYGTLADRIGYKKCLVASSLLAAASYGFYLVDGGFVYLLLLTVGMSVFYNSIQPLLDSLSLTFIDRNPSFSYGSLRLAGAAGWACTGIAAGYYIDKVSTSVIFVFSGVSMALTFLIALLVRTAASERKAATKIESVSVTQILKNGKMLFLLVWVCFVYAASAPIYYFYSIYMKENGASASLTGFAISFQGLCEIPLFYFSAVIIRRFGLGNTLLICVLATTLRLLLYSVITNPWFVIAVELLHGFGWSLFLVACIEQVNRLVNKEARATGQSLLYAALLGAGAILGNMWAGYLYETEMKVSQIYLLNAGIIFVLGIVLLISMRSSASGTNR
jgi:MFS transporter, PPP family, 3-phenylpropionic acid transporter